MLQVDPDIDIVSKEFIRCSKEDIPLTDFDAKYSAISSYISKSIDKDTTSSLFKPIEKYFHHIINNNTIDKIQTDDRIRKDDTDMHENTKVGSKGINDEDIIRSNIDVIDARLMNRDTKKEKTDGRQVDSRERVKRGIEDIRSAIDTIGSRNNTMNDNNTREGFDRTYRYNSGGYAHEDDSVDEDRYKYDIKQTPDVDDRIEYIRYRQVDDRMDVKRGVDGSKERAYKGTVGSRDRYNRLTIDNNNGKTLAGRPYNHIYTHNSTSKSRYDSIKYDCMKTMNELKHYRDNIKYRSYISTPLSSTPVHGSTPRYK